MAPLSPNTHNLNLSPDGKWAFMSPNGKVMSIADTSTHQTVRTIPFNDNIRVFVLNHDASLIYTNQNNFLGFQIADVKTGKVLHTVEVQGYPWRERWNATPRPRIPHGCPSHGIALTNDEKEVWLADGMNDYIHIFDNTVMPPKQIQSIKTTAGPYWITVGLDGTLAYVSSGDIIDMKSRKIIGQMKDEYGRTMYSEKLLDMLFTNGKLTRVANQFGNGLTPATPQHDGKGQLTHPMNVYSRRALLGSAVAVGAGSIALAQASPIPIIDCHIHLIRPNPPARRSLLGRWQGEYRAVVAARYRRLAEPLGIVGAIEVEASPWMEDNLWVLEVEEKDPMMVGTIGNLQPEKPEFKEYLDRYHKNKLFLGIRYGNLWGYNLVTQVENPTFIEGLKLLQQADLAMDTANPRPDLLEALVKVTDKVAGLRIIVDHLPSHASTARCRWEGRRGWDAARTGQAPAGVR